MFWTVSLFVLNKSVVCSPKTKRLKSLQESRKMGSLSVMSEGKFEDLFSPCMDQINTTTSAGAETIIDHTSV